MKYLRSAVHAVVSASFLVLSAPGAQAAYTLTFAQNGPDVVATGSGSLVLLGLNASIDAIQPSYLTDSVNSRIVIGGTALASNPVDQFSGTLNSGAQFFGDTFVDVFAASATGAVVGLATPSSGLFSVFVPLGYAFNTDLGTSTATFANATFASLRLIPGTYVYTWGSELAGTFDSFTIIIPASEPATLALLGAGLLGLVAVRRRRGAY